MNITVEKKPNCIATIRVEIPREKAEETRNKVVSEYVKMAKLPGFRPGKAPRPVVEKRFAEQIQKAVQEELTESALYQAIQQDKLQVISLASSKFDTADDGGRVLMFEVVLKPEFELPEYRGLKVQVERLEITDELLHDVIADQREKFATLKDVVGRPSQMGDFVVLDYTGKIDGQPMRDLLPDAEAFLAENTGYLVKLDSANFLPGFCDQVAGATVEEKKIVVAHIPAEANSAVSGKDAVYEVTVKAVKEQELPEVDDAFAARLMPGKTLAELKQAVREQMEANAERNEEQKKRELALQALRSAVQFELPELLVNNAAQRRVNELVKTNLDRGIDQETLTANEDTILEAATQQAEVDVKDEFLLSAIAKKEGLKVTDDELMLRVRNIAATARTTAKQVLKILKKHDGLENLRSRVLLDKTVDFLVQHAEITVETVQSNAAADQEP
ncbi:MAG: trigger factor [Verrucomicrobiales bacterium]|nr:trigger factor [Verrucomicrobiales bacterium]